MLIFWTSLLLLALLAGPGEAQSCKSEFQGFAQNLAKDRPAFQSSTFPNPFNSVAGKAVDGNCNGDFFQHSSCTHTNLEKDPWWYMDLGDEYAISAVVVQNRGDCCGERLEGAEIRVGDSVAAQSKASPLCGTIADSSLGSLSTIRCNWLKGRYVSVHIPGRSEALTLCEVEVYGTKMLQIAEITG